MIKTRFLKRPPPPPMFEANLNIVVGDIIRIDTLGIDLPLPTISEPIRVDTLTIVKTLTIT